MAVALRDFDHGRQRPSLRLVPPPARPPRHVYWLRRALALAVLAGLLLAIGGVVRAMAVAGPEEVLGRTNLTVVVEPGQTLWDLAERYAPEGRDLVEWADEIARANGLDGRTLQAGMPLQIPLETVVVPAAPDDSAQGASAGGGVHRGASAGGGSAR